MRVSINPRVGYFSFGFLPTGNLIADLKGRLFGFPNLLKRLQVPDILRELNVQDHERVLDLGCGGGYFTIELAKLAREAYGVDIAPSVSAIHVPTELADRLRYMQVSGTTLPFDAGYFDKVLASEVLPMLPDPRELLREVRRVLKPGGRIVISNGAGHPVLRHAFSRRGRFFRYLERAYAHRMPKSYEDYCAVLQRSFGTAQSAFLSQEQVERMLSETGFSRVEFDRSPGFLAGAYLSWFQFLLYLRTGKTLSQQSFLAKFLLFTLVSVFEKQKHQGGLLCSAH